MTPTRRSVPTDQEPSAPDEDRVSLYPLTFEEALEKLLKVDPRKDREDDDGDGS